MMPTEAICARCGSTYTQGCCVGMPGQCDKCESNEERDYLVVKLRKLGYKYMSLDLNKYDTDVLEDVIKATEEFDKKYPLKRLKKILREQRVIRG